MPVDMHELLKYEDVSRITQFKVSTLRKWVQQRKIPFTKINGAIRFDPEEIRVWSAGRRGGGRVSVDRAGELFPEAEGGGDDGHRQSD